MNKVEELRALFKEKLKEGIPDPPREFSPRDLARLKDDRYLRRVVEHCDGNTEGAAKMLWSIMIWRRNVNASEIKDTVRMDYVKEGIFFPHGRDADGCLLFIMKWKLYVKGQKNVEDMKRVVVYWLERMEGQENGGPISLMFDLDGCGMNNIEVEIVSYMISILKNYYPKFVNYIIVYQMPWILNAGFRIVKGLLPARAVEKLRVVNKDKLKDFVRQDQALTCWGGKDEYVFQFDRKITNHVTTKRVTFADGVNETSYRDVIQIIPSDSIIFHADKNYVTSEFTLVNTDNGSLAFKIRTTGPEKFKVKPSSGVLAQASTQIVSVAVLPGFHPDVVNTERFLVVVVKIPDNRISQKQQDEIWRNPNVEVSEKRLRCKLFDDAVRRTSVDESLDNLRVMYVDLNKSVNTLKLFELVTLTFSLAIVVFGYLMYSRTNGTFCDIV